MRGSAINVVVGGAAGQGIATFSEILCKALVRQGFSIVVSQDYMSRVRGGHNTFAIRTSPEKIMAPEDPIDVLVALNQETVQKHRDAMSKESCIIGGGDESFESGADNLLKVPYNQFAKKMYHNVAGLGVVGSLLALDRGLLKKTVHDYFGKKSDEAIKANEEALNSAFEWTEENADHPYLKLAQPESNGKRLMMDGNQAIALGALSAGVKFYTFYPMTPSTSIGQTLAGMMKKGLPIVVEQVEDEIGVMNMAIGASFAGVPAMVGTSGGGFALMVEGLSLAAATETPIVVAMGQRPSPATGLPTRTEQGDLEFVIHAGHGEFPRAVLSPGNPEQCFYLTRKAFQLAEKTQGPVFILTDEFLADSFRDVEHFDMDSMEPVVPGADPASVPDEYKRYAYTDSGVSPRLVPGRSEKLVKADSHEHYENGHIAEDAQVRTAMVDKRLKKMEIIKEEAVPPDLYGDKDADIMLACWGSTLGSAREAAEMMKENGKNTSVLHFTQVWPLIPEKFKDTLDSAKEIACIEQNATGQFARLLWREAGIKVHRQVKKYDGRRIAPEDIVSALGQG